MNQVWHGDCLELMKGIEDKSVQLILTDIPYGECDKKSNGLRNLDKGLANTVDFDLTKLLDELYRVSNGGIYIFCGIEQIGAIYTYWSNKKDFMVRQCAWRKTNPPPTNGQHLWLSSFENCIFAKKRKTPFYQSCKSSIWDYPVGRSKIHPTQKPIALFEHLINSSSKEGDLVLDPFSGSGTTGIACLNTNRNYILIEKDKNYYDIINNRIGEHTKCH